MDGNLRLLRENLKKTDDALTALLLAGSDLRSIVGADGATVYYDGRCLAAGLTPGAGPAGELVRWIAGEHAADLFATDALAASRPPAAAWDTAAGGVLVRILSRDPLAAVACFRRATLRTADRSGDRPGGAPPARPGVGRAGGAPGRCRPWGRVAVGTMERLSEALAAEGTAGGTVGAALAGRLAAGFAALAGRSLTRHELAAVYLDALADGATITVATDDRHKVRIVTISPGLAVDLDGVLGDPDGLDFAALLARLGLPEPDAGTGRDPSQPPRLRSARLGDREFVLHRRTLVELLDERGILRRWSAFLFEDVTGSRAVETALRDFRNRSGLPPEEA